MYNSLNLGGYLLIKERSGDWQDFFFFVGGGFLSGGGDLAKEGFLQEGGFGCRFFFCRRGVLVGGGFCPEGCFVLFPINGIDCFSFQRKYLFHLQIYLIYCLSIRIPENYYRQQNLLPSRAESKVFSLWGHGKEVEPKISCTKYFNWKSLSYTWHNSEASECNFD